jgi:HlyD family secretion protein
MRAKIILAGTLVLAAAACRDQGPRDGISASGTIEAVSVNVGSKVSGEVRELLVEEGARVEPGDRLAVIDHDALDIQLRQARAGAELARAQLELLRSGARREDIQQAEEALKQAEASLKVAGDDARRMRELYEGGSVSLKLRDDAEARLIVSRAQRDSAVEALNKLRRLARPEEIRAAEARLAQALGAADLLERTIADCTISAPVAGVVTRKGLEAGELATPGATVVTIARLDSVHVMIYVTAQELGRVRLGDAVDVRIDSFPDRAFPGRVTYISPEAEFTPKNVQTRQDRVKLVFGVKVEIENREGLLKPGLPADALIKTGSGIP